MAISAQRYGPTTAEVWDDFRRRDQYARDQGDRAYRELLAQPAADQAAGRAFGARMQSEANARIAPQRQMEAAQAGFGRQMETARDEADATARDAIAEQDWLAQSSRNNQARYAAASQRAGQSSWDQYLAGLTQARTQAARPRTVDAMPATPTAVMREGPTGQEQRTNAANYQRSVAALTASRGAETQQNLFAEAMRRTPVGGTAAIGNRLYIRSPDGFRPYDGQTEGDLEYADPTASAVAATPTAVQAEPTAVPRSSWDERKSALSRAGEAWSDANSESTIAMALLDEDDFGGYVRRTAAKYRGVVPQSQQTDRDMAARTAAVRGGMDEQAAVAREQRRVGEMEQAANRRRVAPAVEPYRWSFA